MNETDYDEKQRLSKKLIILNTKMQQLRESKYWHPKDKYCVNAIGGTVINDNGNPSGRIADCFSETNQDLTEDLYYLNDKIDCVIDVLECLLENIL